MGMVTSLWFSGPTRTGKTGQLVEQFAKRAEDLSKSQILQGKPPILLFAANDDSRRQLVDRLNQAVAGRYPVVVKTPLGFFQDEVFLYFPAVVKKLAVAGITVPIFPLRLRSETEQRLATKLWRDRLGSKILQTAGVSEYRLVRRILDLMLLAGLSGTAIADIPTLLREGWAGEPELYPLFGELIQEWWLWCLQRGLISYGIMAYLYWQYLLPNPLYQKQLLDRTQAVLADDVDDYPAIAGQLFHWLLDHNAQGVFTYNPHGKIRLGLNADPDYLHTLAERCQIYFLERERPITYEVIELVSNPVFLPNLPDWIQSLQTTSRAQMLRQTAAAVVQLVQTGQAQPREIAVIAPGLEAIARYTLTNILTKAGIGVYCLNDQRPLNTEVLIRALLTLLALVYPGLGKLVSASAITEMLVVLSQSDKKSYGLDPVRAGLVVDYCFVPDLEMPRLQPVEAFPRWDRLGNEGATNYREICQWIAEQQQQQQQRLIANPVILIDRAIQQFILARMSPSYEQLASLRELMETAQHFWEVERRLQQGRSYTEAIADFVEMLNYGTVTANPYPVQRLTPASENTVTLANIFQYRSQKSSHRYHFWLDAGSPLWLSGGSATLYAAPVFLKNWNGQPWNAENEYDADEARLHRILHDLLGRVEANLYLCHSDLAANGQEQAGPLLSVVNAARPIEFSPITDI